MKEKDIQKKKRILPSTKQFLLIDKFGHSDTKDDNIFDPCLATNIPERGWVGDGCLGVDSPVLLAT